MDLLGLLRGFVGDQPAKKPQRTWKGPGFNMIWRPISATSPGPKEALSAIEHDRGNPRIYRYHRPRELQTAVCCRKISSSAVPHTFSRSMTVSTTAGSISSRVCGPTYPRRTIRTSRSRSCGWYPFRTARPSTCRVPPLRSPGQPHFAVSSITPFRIGSPDDGVTGLVPFPDEEDFLLQTEPARTDLARVASLTQAQLSNPNPSVPGNSRSEHYQHHGPGHHFGL